MSTRNRFQNRSALPRSLALIMALDPAHQHGMQRFAMAGLRPNSRQLFPWRLSRRLAGLLRHPEITPPLIYHHRRETILLDKASHTTGDYSLITTD